MLLHFLEFSPESYLYGKGEEEMGELFPHFKGTAKCWS